MQDELLHQPFTDQLGERRIYTKRVFLNKKPVKSHLVNSFKPLEAVSLNQTISQERILHEGRLAKIICDGAIRMNILPHEFMPASIARNILNNLPVTVTSLNFATWPMSFENEADQILLAIL